VIGQIEHPRAGRLGRDEFVHGIKQCAELAGFDQLRQRQRDDSYLAFLSVCYEAVRHNANRA
jgi:hypothetical protein